MPGWGKEPAPAGSAPRGPARESAERLFGEHLRGAEAFARILVTDGVRRGLIGPREAPRIWERHLLNCAAVEELVPTGASVTDVGSGAGLPGIVLAVARPDLTVTLLEPMARRTSFLEYAVEALQLTGRVAVVRARADECPGVVPVAAVVSARAVARLDRLAGWCLPLTAVGGRILAVKGESAREEVAAHAAAVRRAGGGTPVIRHCGVGFLDPPTTVVEIVRTRA